MKEDPGASESVITRTAKAKVKGADTTSRLNHSRGLVIQGQTVREFERKDASTWTSAVHCRPERVFKFVLNATDTLPHNKNLCLWRKVPSPACPLIKTRASFTSSTTALWLCV
jgi:hypothetical protein